MNQKNNPLHGKTLESILREMQERLGWEGLAAQIPVRCFQDNPSINSSLKFLRKTDWARKKLEDLYLGG
ncbi:MAG: VF530 family protein [Chitinophagaceae bacterium]